MSRPIAPCGTSGGYRGHINHGQEPCQPCRDAIAAYMREKRKEPKFKAKDRARNAARYRALERLAAEHPQRFRAILDEEFLAVYMPGGVAS